MGVIHEKPDFKNTDDKWYKENSNDIKDKWYIFRVQTGREDGLVQSLKNSFTLLAKDGIDGKQFFTDFSVPKHNVVKYVNGKKVEKNVNAYPGYIFLKVKMTDDIILFLRRFFQMNGFGQMLPHPITDAEYKKMMDKVNGLSDGSKQFVFRIGQRVKINSGSFATMEGNVKTIDEKNRRLVVTVEIFGCPTDIDIEFENVSILED